MRFVATVTIHQDDDWFVAKCLDVNVASQGKTMDEAMVNLREALELYFEDTDDAPSATQVFVTTMEIAI